MKKITLYFGLVLLFFNISFAQDCPDDWAGTTQPAARFANGGQIYLEWSTEAGAGAVWTFLSHWQTLLQVA